LSPVSDLIDGIDGPADTVLPRPVPTSWLLGTRDENIRVVFIAVLIQLLDGTILGRDATLTTNVRSKMTDWRVYRPVAGLIY